MEERFCTHISDLYAAHLVFNCSYLIINVLLLLQVLTNLREQKAPQKFTDNFPIEVGISHLLQFDMVIYTLFIYFSLKAELIRTLLEQEPSKRPTAEHVHDCDPMKRLRKKLKKSQACIPVLWYSVVLLYCPSVLICIIFFLIYSCFRILVLF